MIKSLALALLAVLALAGPAAACREIREPDACLFSWGDPRVTFYLHNEASNVPVTFKGVFFRATDGERVRFYKTVAAHTSVDTTRWVKGGTRASVYDAKTGALLSRITAQAGTTSCVTNGLP